MHSRALRKGKTRFYNMLVESLLAASQRVYLTDVTKLYLRAHHVQDPRKSFKFNNRSNALFVQVLREELKALAGVTHIICLGKRAAQALQEIYPETRGPARTPALVCVPHPRAFREPWKALGLTPFTYEAKLSYILRQFNGS